MQILNARLLSLAASACLFAPLPTTAQAPARPAVRRSPAAATRKPAVAAAKPASACVATPTLSPKIPAIPAGTGCVKSLYALKFEASHLDPQISAPLRTSLEALNQNFSLDYIDTKVGTGELAQPRKYYTVNYTGYLLDGTKFDSSLDPGREPFTFPYGGRQVIQGWDTGFEGMRAGGKRRLFVPYQLAYGERGKLPVIPAKAVLIFDVEFISQSDTPPAPKTPAVPPAPPAGATPPASTTPPSSTSPPASTTSPTTPPGGTATPNPTAPSQPATPPATPSGTPPQH